MDRGFAIYVLVLIWMGVMTCLPQIIFDGDYIALTGAISCCLGLAIFALANEGKKNAFVANLPLTYLHVAILVSYAFVGLFMIAFKDINNNSIRPLAQSILAYIAYPILSFIVETIINEKKEKAELSKIRVGAFYEERNSQEELPWYSNDKDLIIIGYTLWRVKEVRSPHDILLCDANKPNRTKVSTLEELKKLKEMESERTYRTPEYYEYLTRIITNRAKEDFTNNT